MSPCSRGSCIVQGPEVRASGPLTLVNKDNKKQLSWMSRGKVVRRPPGSAVFEDGVEDQ